MNTVINIPQSGDLVNENRLQLSFTLNLSTNQHGMRSLSLAVNYYYEREPCIVVGITFGGGIQSRLFSPIYRFRSTRFEQCIVRNDSLQKRGYFTYKVYGLNLAGHRFASQGIYLPLYAFVRFN